MPARLLADVVVVVHAAFIAFVVAGGLLVLRRHRVAWLHVPAVAWAAFIEFSAGLCPLTPIENALRRGAGEAGYGGGYIDHYLIPLIYPAGLTPRMQAAIGVAVVALNLAVYAAAWRRRRRDAAPQDGMDRSGGTRRAPFGRQCTFTFAPPAGLRVHRARVANPVEGDRRMTLCPIAIAVGCRKCPVVAVCPLKSVIGDYRAEDAEKPKATAAQSKPSKPAK